MTGDARRQYVASWLSAACLAEGISESPLLWLDGVELTNDTRSCEMAGVAVSRLDILARQRRRSAAGSVRIETSAVSALRRTTAPDRDHGWQWPSPRQSRVVSTRVHESRHKLSGQRMMRMKTHQASGRASALRGGHTIAPTANFKTRIEPCRIAARDDLEKCEQFTKNRPRGSDICTPSGDQQSRIPSREALPLRFTDDCQLKTDDSQRSCGLRFPYATCRCNTTGLLEQMP